MADNLQGLRHQSAIDISGVAGSYNESMRALFAAEATIPAGTSFNGAMLLWLSARLGSTQTNLIDAQNAFAASLGVPSWDEVGTFAAAGGGGGGGFSSGFSDGFD